jgi:AcrR family transcriptional regulator
MVEGVPRAAAMSVDQRRDALVQATLPLLVDYGRFVTTKMIAEAAGVAEGTIFRVFDSKEELVEAAIQQGFDPSRFLHDLDDVDPTTPLRPRLVEIVTILQRRFTELFGLMHAVGMVAPPDHHSQAHVDSREAINAQLVSLVAGDADLLSVEPEQLLHIVRLLTFSGSHPRISDGHTLTPTQIVDVVLDGVLSKDR